MLGEFFELGFLAIITFNFISTASIGCFIYYLYVVNLRQLANVNPIWSVWGKRHRILLFWKVKSKFVSGLCLFFRLSFTLNTQIVSRKPYFLIWMLTYFLISSWNSQNLYDNCFQNVYPWFHIYLFYRIFHNCSTYLIKPE